MPSYKIQVIDPYDISKVRAEISGAATPLVGDCVTLEDGERHEITKVEFLSQEHGFIVRIARTPV